MLSRNTIPNCFPIAVNTIKELASGQMSQRYDMGLRIANWASGYFEKQFPFALLINSESGCKMALCTEKELLPLELKLFSSLSMKYLFQSENVSTKKCYIKRKFHRMPSKHPTILERQQLFCEFLMRIASGV